VSDFLRRNDVRPAEAILAAAFAIWYVLIGAGWFVTRFPLAGLYAGLNTFLALLILVFRPKLVAATSGPLFILRHWYPVFFYGVFFIETAELVPALNTRTWDAELIRADRALFRGSDPTVEMASWAHPLLTEILMLCYVSYYILPLVAGGYVFLKRSVAAYHNALTAMSIGFYVSYLCYFFVPAVGPRFEIVHPTELRGVLTYEAIRGFLDSAEGRMHDCFPSGHTALTIVTLVFAWRLGRPAFWWILLPALGLIFSTVYLRYHYVIDLFAALPVVALSLLAGPWLERWWDRRLGTRSLTAGENAAAPQESAAIQAPK
jgi:hypothetical protein